MTPWELRTTKRFLKSLKKLDKTVATQVLRDLNRLAALDDPTKPCKALSGPLKGLWRYRVGDWRVILDIRRGELVILALDVQHRSQVYKEWNRR
ncbi:type II toxin-antitoxin system RelE/ParE family toxin [Bifidobacterium sp. ESL0728]|uniref:type II toxin-antitoxin system RelE family toxin n=1 Tax=Bifidobacterium sp. ESL0728 TaxID=2983220 RepID=UPI0023FA31B6|nr:type II toxin-antitoxin system RelE/ParE family toxin [Bifidobacterium sp. ESL0728]WEV58971.1 type II toxin-antitoxin system RelE/ParE family toxin [Bifidobacterium sp. ESL0728]